MALVPYSYVLYAEDNAIDASFFRRAFTSLDPDTTLTHRDNGIATRDLLLEKVARRDVLPRLIILDIKMPGLSGLDVLEFIRAEPVLRHLPVLILSASAEARDIERAYRSDANAYLVKPDRYYQLKDLVKAIDVFWIRYNRVA